MDRLTAALIRLEKDLRALRCRWALIGGLAVSARTEPRTTKDIDIAVAVGSDLEADSLIRDLQARGYAFLPEEFHFHHTVHDRVATIRLVSPGLPGAQAIVDLLFASSGIEPEVVAAAEPVEVYPGFRVLVATTGHLLALKVLAAGPRRLQDFTDLQALAAHASAAERVRARLAVELISERGYDGGKNLQVELEKVLSSPPGGP